MNEISYEKLVIGFVTPILVKSLAVNFSKAGLSGLFMGGIILKLGFKMQTTIILCTTYYVQMILSQ